MAEKIDLVQLEGLKNGDEAVFEVVFDRLWEPICGFCGRFVSTMRFVSAMEAEDMAAITFEKLWKARATIKNPQHLTRLAYLIAKNTCIDFLRTSGPRMPGSDLIEAFGNKLFESESDPSWISIDADLMKLHELIDRTKKEIREMPKQYGKVLRLSILEQKKPAEIANMLGVSDNTVKAHLVAARRQLRKRLQELGFPPNFIKKDVFSYFISQLRRKNI